MEFLGNFIQSVGKFLKKKKKVRGFPFFRPSTFGKRALGRGEFLGKGLQPILEKDRANLPGGKS
jgi:hypothetical protein